MRSDAGARLEWETLSTQLSGSYGPVGLLLPTLNGGLETQNTRHESFTREMHSRHEDPHAPNMPEARRLVVVHTAANRIMYATRDYRQVRGDLHSREEESLLTHNDDRLVQEHSHL